MCLFAFQHPGDRLGGAATEFARASARVPTLVYPAPAKRKLRRATAHRSGTHTHSLLAEGNRTIFQYLLFPDRRSGKTPAVKWTLRPPGPGRLETTLQEKRTRNRNPGKDETLCDLHTTLLRKATRNQETTTRGTSSAQRGDTPVRTTCVLTCTAKNEHRPRWRLGSENEVHPT